MPPLMKAIPSIISRAVTGSSCRDNDPDCKPATAKQTMIIAIVFGVLMFLIILMVLWWYRCLCCCCCCSRKNDKRSCKERIKDGFEGWATGGKRPEKKGAYQKVEEQQHAGGSSAIVVPTVDTSYSGSGGHGGSSIGVGAMGGSGGGGSGFSSFF